ncbi:hypothetical protein [uncultured Acetobacteroides sp.]|uniref:hypothetical protein n=1 Tax=uncultured Acetobacteroides sp. TaxID=1760811 RepID=UPI0029F51D3C|nr:hypothetical protein [uncultured Acetobacteroides sp.]
MPTIFLSCIPLSFDKFNTYLLNTISFLYDGTSTANYVRLGIPEAIVKGWKDIGTQWTPLYSKYSDKYNLRTQAVSDELRAMIESTRKYEEENHLIALVAISPKATVTDMETFNINGANGQKKNRTVPQSQITSLVNAILKPIGGGSISIKCYDANSKRASIKETANCVQYRYCIGNTAPASVEDAILDMDISTKSSFILQAGAENEGKRLHIYFRWYNTKHPEIASPWCPLQSAIIV